MYSLLINSVDVYDKPCLKEPLLLLWTGSVFITPIGEIGLTERIIVGMSKRHYNDSFHAWGIFVDSITEPSGREKNFNCKVTNLEMSNAGTTTTRFKGSDMEKELEALSKNGLIDQTTTAKEAYEMSLVFKRDITFDKFQPKYYNWRKKKSFSEEAGRNGGYAPPE
ncbi:hypothetical protein G9A89_002149, partial [Geosiphon pyriformis]